MSRFTIYFFNIISSGLKVNYFFEKNQKKLIIRKFSGKILLSNKGGDNMAGIGSNIRTIRISLGMTQEELAAKMGYKSKSTINKIELGKNDIPQSKIKQFAEALDTTPSALMGWEKVQKNNDTIVGIIGRLRTDEDFLSLVEKLNKLDGDKIAGVNQMLSVLLK